jgi:hypothetical protein
MDPKENEGQEPEQSPPPASEPAQPPPADPAQPQTETPTDLPAPAVDEDEEDTTTELTAVEYEAEIKSLRKESARRRTQRNAAQARVTELEAEIASLRAQAAPPDPAAEATARAVTAERQVARLEIAGELGVSPALMKAAEAFASATDPEAIRAALTELHSQVATAQAAQTPPPPPNPAPPGGPARVQSLDEQIKAAEDAGDWRKSLALKNQKAQQLKKR